MAKCTALFAVGSLRLKGLFWWAMDGNISCHAPLCRSGDLSALTASSGYQPTNCTQLLQHKPQDYAVPARSWCGNADGVEQLGYRPDHSRLPRTTSRQWKCPTRMRSPGKAHVPDECFNRFAGGQLYGMRPGKLNHALNSGAARAALV